MLQITSEIRTLIKTALAEDLSQGGDVTTNLTIPADKIATATFVSRENGVLAGLDIALLAFSEIDADVKITKFAQDGDILKPQTKIAEVSGNARAILMAERTALNILSHLSAIASETAKYVEAVQGTNAKITCTRKTLPGLRELQKYAVKTGGGTNHRFSLGDAIMIKDNHIAVAGGVKPALKAMQNAPENIKIEIEVDTLDQLQEVLDHGGADIVLLDNMDTKTLEKAVAMVNGVMKTEASGGVTLATVKDIAKTGVDYISVGALTHSVKALDIGLDIEI